MNSTMTVFEENVKIKSKIHDYIDNNCIFRCNPDVIYSNATEPGILITKENKKSNHAIFLGRLLHNSVMTYYTSVLLLHEIINYYKSIEQVPFFQLCGIGTESLLLITAIQQNALKHNLNINAFSIKEQKNPYELSTIVEGIPTNAPVIIIKESIDDDVSISKCIEICKNDLNLDIIDQLYAIITTIDDQSYQIKYDQTIFTVNSIFTKDDFDVKYDPEKYWLPKDCGKIINKRLEYI